MEIHHLPIESIHHRQDARSRSDDALAELASSIDKIGLINPIRVRMVGDEYEVIAGSHRLQAVDSLGWRKVPSIVTSDDDIAAELAMIAENLHRAELTVLQRGEQIARWTELSTQGRITQTVIADHDGVSAQVAPKSPGRPESGINAASRELGIERTDAQRAIKVASLSEEAKEAARNIGLDNNRSALLNAAKQPNAAAQVQALQQHRAGGIAARFAPANTVSPQPVPSKAFERFVSLVDEIEALAITDLLHAAGRQRSVLGQRASGLGDRMNEIMEALDQ